MQSDLSESITTEDGLFVDEESFRIEVFEGGKWVGWSTHTTRSQALARLALDRAE